MEYVTSGFLFVLDLLCCETLFRCSVTRFAGEFRVDGRQYQYVCDEVDAWGHCWQMPSRNASCKKILSETNYLSTINSTNNIPRMHQNQ